MAQMERTHRNSETRTPPTVEQLLNDDAQWSAQGTPTLGFQEEDHGHHSNHSSKKSVLAKVKERTKRWRESLAKRRQNPEDNVTPTWGVSLEEEDDQEEEEEAEYLGAPMYESEKAPEACKETARQHPRANPVIPENHLLSTASNTTGNSEEHDEENDPAAKNKTITQTVLEPIAAMLAPAYSTVSEATHQIASKIHGQAGSADNTPTGNFASTVAGAGAHEQQWDKGVSVKEYLIQKLEPGEDERALSQVITKAISPRKSTGGDNHDTGVVEKVRGSLSSILLTTDDDEASSVSSTKTTKNPGYNAPANIPVSTNAYSAVAENEERKNEGRVLQAN